MAVRVCICVRACVRACGGVRAGALKDVLKKLSGRGELRLGAQQRVVFEAQMRGFSCQEHLG